MAMAVVLVLLVVGSLLFHYLSPWYFTPIASNWGTIDDTVSITFWVTGFVFVVVNLFMAYCVLRYRSGKTKAAHYEPENKKLEGWLVLLTSVGVAAMLTPGLFAWAKFIDVPKDAACRGGHRPPMELQLPVPGRGRRAGHRRRALRDRHESVRHQSGRSARTRRRPDRDPGAAYSRRQADQDGAAVDRRAARLHRAADAVEDEHGAGPRHLSVVHADSRGDLRRLLRAAVRDRALRDARHRRSSRTRAPFQKWKSGLSDVRADRRPKRPATRRRARRSTRSARPATARRARAIPRSMRRSLPDSRTGT